MNIIQIYLLVFVILFVVALASRSIMFRKMFKSSPLAFLKSPRLGEKMVWSLTFLVLFTYIVLMIYTVFHFTQPFVEFTLFFFVVGIILTLLGLFLMVISQAQMGRSWRMGIAHDNKKLVTHGVFNISRNPIYFGIILIVIGIFFLLLTLFSFLLALLTILLLVMIILTEERYLEKQFKEEYRTYKRKVGRFW